MCPHCADLRCPVFAGVECDLSVPRRLSRALAGSPRGMRACEQAPGGARLCCPTSRGGLLGGLRLGREGGRLGEQAGLALFLQPEALALDVERGGVVQQAIEDGGGHDLIAEHLVPVGKALVGGEYRGGPLVAAGDEAELNSFLVYGVG